MKTNFVKPAAASKIHSSRKISTIFWPAATKYAEVATWNYKGAQYGNADERPSVILFVTDLDHPLPHAYSIQKTFLENEISTTVMRASGDVERGHLKDESQAEWKLDSTTIVLWVMNRM